MKRAKAIYRLYLADAGKDPLSFKDWVKSGALAGRGELQGKLKGLVAA